MDRTVPSEGSESHPIVLSGVQCNGGEESLAQCFHSGTVSNCSHNKDAGMRCGKKDPP